MERRLQFSLVVFCLVILSWTARSDLIISSVEKWVYLQSHIVRVISFIKVENQGPDDVSEVLLAFPDSQAKNLATILTIYSEEGEIISFEYPINSTKPKSKPSDMTFYPATLPKKLGKGKTVGLDVLFVLTNYLKPLPKEITQAESQLLVYTDNIYYTSPYRIKNQSVVFWMPGRIESYSKYPQMKLVESELRYGPFEEQPPFSYSPVVVHFENNKSFAVASKFVQEIEISHWGNIQVTEQYTLIHGGAHLKNGFSRFDYQARPPSMSGPSSFKNLVARLPPRAHSIYYRDEIGNISTSHLWGDSQGTKLEMELRFPMFGGWKTTFTVGYSLPLHDFLCESDDGNSVLSITFGCPIEEILVEKQIVRVVLPEGSKDISVKTAFPTKQSRDVCQLKYSHLDIVGRPVVVLEKHNVVPEHKLYFEVYYKFNNIFLLGEAIMLIFGIFLMFLICILYMHTDLTISKTSSWEEVCIAMQHIRNIFGQYLMVHDELESSLLELFHNGDVQLCKAAHEAADARFKELAEELKPLLTYLQSCFQASSILPQIEELVRKEKKLQVMEMTKHTTVVKWFAYGPISKKKKKSAKIQTAELPL